MILELIGKKIFSNITPYKRTYISIEVEKDNQKTIYTLPSTNTSAFFLNQNDLIYIDNIDDLEKLCYIDYDLINQKDKSNIKYFEDFQLFKQTVKNSIAAIGYFSIIINRKIIFSNVLHIICTIHDDTEQITTSIN